ncbi:MAG TPA: hypothetical protein VJ044_05400, partial [Candidatus Hodarchaeales archaeon]|nr:hypothetical protein [Candidatus Hodarchaeales archaeon]
VMFYEDNDKKKDGLQGKTRESSSDAGSTETGTKPSKNSLLRTITNRILQEKGKKIPIHVFMFNSEVGNLLIIGLLIILGITINSVIITPFQNGGNHVEMLNINGNTWDESTMAGSVEAIKGVSGSSTVLYLVPAKLRITSSGIFNWVEKIELRLDTKDTSPTSIWSIPYSLDRQIDIRIVVPIPAVFINSSSINVLLLRFTVISSGLFSERPSDFLYQLRFNA